MPLTNIVIFGISGLFLAFIVLVFAYRITIAILDAGLRGKIHTNQSHCAFEAWQDFSPEYLLNGKYIPGIFTDAGALLVMWFMLLMTLLIIVAAAPISYYVLGVVVFWVALFGTTFLYRKRSVKKQNLCKRLKGEEIKLFEEVK